MFFEIFASGGPTGMDSLEILRKITGGVLTTTAVAGAAAHDWFSGVTVSGFTAASVALVGGGLLIYDNVRAKIRENRRKDLDLELELDAKRKETLSAQIESLRQASEDNQQKMRHTLHDVNNKLAAIVMERDVLREDLHATHKVLRETQSDLRETLDRWHEATEDLQRANSQVAESERRITELTRQIEALRKQTNLIEGNTRQAADEMRRLSDSRTDLSTHLAPRVTPDPDSDSDSDSPVSQT